MSSLACWLSALLSRLFLIFAVRGLASAFGSAIGLETGERLRDRSLRRVGDRRAALSRLRHRLGRDLVGRGRVVLVSRLGLVVVLELVIRRLHVGEVVAVQVLDAEQRKR